MMEQDSEPSLYYISENGQLRASFKRKREYSFDVIPVTKQLRKDEGTNSILNVTESDSGLLRYQLPLTTMTTLKRLALGFVARNILLVESLVGIPELIGEELFHEVVRFGLVDKPSNTCRRILKVFCDAYKNAVAEELSFSSKGLDLDFCFEALTSFQHLSKLDLTGCKLWAVEEECMTFLAHLSHLTHLSLKDTGLSNNALRQLANISFYQKGLLQLNTLDLSCNRLIDHKSLRILHRFRALKALNLSDTSVSSISLEEQKKLRLFVLTEGLEHLFSTSSVVNKGWAAKVVDQWTAKENRRMELAAYAKGNESAPESDLSTLSAQSFYSKTKVKRSSEYLHKVSKLKDFDSSKQEMLEGHPLYLVSHDMFEEVCKGRPLVPADLVFSTAPDSINARAMTSQKKFPAAILTTHSTISSINDNSSIFATYSLGHKGSESTFSAYDHLRTLSPESSDPQYVETCGDHKPCVIISDSGHQQINKINRDTIFSKNTKSKPASLWKAMNSSLW